MQLTVGQTKQIVIVGRDDAGDPALVYEPAGGPGAFGGYDGTLIDVAPSGTSAQVTGKAPGSTTITGCAYAQDDLNGQRFCADLSVEVTAVATSVEVQEVV